MERFFFSRLKLEVQNRMVGHFKHKVQKIGSQIHAVQFRGKRPFHLSLSRDAKRSERMVAKRQRKMFEYQVLAVTRYDCDSSASPIIRHTRRSVQRDAGEAP